MRSGSGFAIDAVNTGSFAGVCVSADFDKVRVFALADEFCSNIFRDFSKRLVVLRKMCFQR